MTDMTFMWQDAEACQHASRALDKLRWRFNSDIETSPDFDGEDEEGLQQVRWALQSLRGIMCLEIPDESDHAAGPIWKTLLEMMRDRFAEKFKNHTTNEVLTSWEKAWEKFCAQLYQFPEEPFRLTSDEQALVYPILLEWLDRLIAEQQDLQMKMYA